MTVVTFFASQLLASTKKSDCMKTNWISYFGLWLKRYESRLAFRQY